MKRVAIIGVGAIPLRSRTPDVSYKEMVYAAAREAYREAGIGPGEIQTFVTCAEDLNEGISIFDEYTPDPLGAVQKPVHTVCHDGIVGLANAFMQIQSGVAEIAVVEAHSKASNIKSKNEILSYALDPLWTRPLGLNPHFVAGLEMNAYLTRSGNTEQGCAAVAVKNKGYAGRRLTLSRVMGSKPVSAPLKELEIGCPADGAVVLVVASEAKTRRSPGRPVWISGISWSSGAPSLESREWGRARYAEDSARRAFGMAGIGSPKEIDLFELDDTYAYKELQHMEAVGLFDAGDSGAAVLKNLDRDGADDWRVNRSGGILGKGDALEANGLYRVARLAAQIRGREFLGAQPVGNVRTGFALSWRGVPTASGAAALLSHS